MTEPYSPAVPFGERSGPGGRGTSKRPNFPVISETVSPGKENGLTGKWRCCLEGVLILRPLRGSLGKESRVDW